MGNVIELDSQRPHLVINADDAAHVVPVALALAWASGAEPLPSEPILRRIIVEWLCCAEAGCIEHACREAED